MRKGARARATTSPALDRQPRERGRSACGRGGHRGGSALPGDLEPEKLTATAVYGATIYAVDGSYDDCSWLSVRLSFELDWSFVNVGLRSYYAEGSKTLAFEIAEQLGWKLPTAVVGPIASGALFSKGTRLPAARDRPVDGGSASLRRAGGRAPVAAAFAEERKVTRFARTRRALARIGNPADGDLAVATARATDGAIYAVDEDEVGENMAFLAETTGVFGRPPRA